MRVEIVTIGNEVLSGRTLDTNFAFLARALEEADVQVGWHSTVGDTVKDIGEVLRLAIERADAVVMTGGLGPTPDDLTRKAVASLLRRPLELDEDVLAAIRERAKRFKRKTPVSIESQALIPRGAEVWKNPVGTAPGLKLESHKKPVILLPGVPAEMEALAREFVVPFLRARSGRKVETFTLRTSGVWESMLHEKIGNLPQQWAGASLAYLPSYFGVDLRVTVSGTDEAAVQDVTLRAYESLKALVAPVIYAEGGATIEEVVGELLVEKQWTVAVAESCTGGLVAKRLTDVPGSSRYFERGFVTYSNRSKVELLGVIETDLAAHGAVSAAIAEQMARGARERSGAQLGVGITGIAGPEGGSEEKPVGTVFIAISTDEGDAVRDFRIPAGRQAVRERAAQQALDLMRRRLQGLPLEPRLD
ncbi:MAG: competence/damage-inducible protein A [Candidatus Eisenbacteria bacterium]|uniref:CinA-like protein n=1 Tax=Eiseniibacteriota bacterium TaxID=2212470 RepID=A0A849SGL2_UNCEI|nr:competence/damage-inducible protein A [Candidatus Eisenbacteria bacterium]